MLDSGMRPVGRRPGKLGHSGVLYGGTRELLLKMTVQLQAERVSSRIILRQERLEGRRPMDSIRGCWHTRVSESRLRRGLRSGVEHKVLECTVVVAVVQIGSRWLIGWGRGKP